MQEIAPAAPEVEDGGLADESIRHRLVLVHHLVLRAPETLECNRVEPGRIAPRRVGLERAQPAFRKALVRLERVDPGLNSFENLVDLDVVDGQLPHDAVQRLGVLLHHVQRALDVSGRNVTDRLLKHLPAGDVRVGRDPRSGEPADRTKRCGDLLG